MKFDKKKQPQYRVNEQIHVKEVRIVGEGVESVVMPTRDALRMAEENGVDLVEISPNAVPPVCRLIEYSKFLYQQKKKAKEMKAKQVKVELKEIRFGPQTAEADYNFKLKHAIGEVLLLRFANDLEEIAKVENMPVLEGKRMSIMLSPKKPGQPKKSQQKADAERKLISEKNKSAAPAVEETATAEIEETSSEE